MAYKPKVLTVPEGGSGAASETAYAVLCGGTSSTSAIQSIAGLGSSGQILTSNGASALPTFQSVSGGSTANVLSISTAWTSGTLVDGQTYFIVPFGFVNGATSSGVVDTRIYMPVSGTITKAYGAFRVGTNGTNENCTLAIRLNNTTDTNISTTVTLNSASVAVSNAALSISVSAGDYIEFKFISPTWATNPTDVGLSMSILVT